MRYVSPASCPPIARGDVLVQVLLAVVVQAAANYTALITLTFDEADIDEPSIDELVDLHEHYQVLLAAYLQLLDKALAPLAVAV